VVVNRARFVIKKGFQPVVGAGKGPNKNQGSVEEEKKSVLSHRMKRGWAVNGAHPQKAYGSWGRGKGVLGKKKLRSDRKKVGEGNCRREKNDRRR